MFSGRVTYKCKEKSWITEYFINIRNMYADNIFLLFS